MLDVAAVTRALISRALSTSVVDTLASGMGLSHDAAEEWLPFIAALHDLGKAWPGFQGQCPHLRNGLIERGLEWPRTKAEGIPHAHCTAAALAGILSNAELLAPTLPGETARRLAQTLGGHHGTFPTSADIRFAERHMMRAERKRPAWGEVRVDLVRRLAQLLAMPADAAPCLSTKDNITPMLLVGLVTVADWIGSNTDYFPSQNDIGEPSAYWSLAQEKASQAVALLGWDSWSPPLDPASFADLFPPFAGRERPLQVLAGRISDGSPRPCLVIVEAPMGEGKTEAAMLLQDGWCVSNAQAGAYFALPTMATSNQMFQRVEEYLATRHGEQRTNLHLLHGRAMLSDAYARLRTAALNQDAHDPGNEALVADEWFVHAKRGLLAPFAVGTIDQALMSVLQTRHGYLRLYGLAGKTLVFDEVHAYDTYMLTLFERLMEWLGALGATVVILSATLPKARREALLRAYGANSDLAGSVPYPRMTWLDTSGEVQAAGLDVTMRHTLQLDWREDDPKAMAHHFRDCLSGGGCAAWVCNTVKRAQTVYSALRGELGDTGIRIRLFHARFPFGDRQRIENEVLEAYGRERVGTEPSLLVATQVIEQSLDLDFDLMVTDLAPVDLVLQRSGRMHRHDRPRPERLRDRRLIVIKPTGHDASDPDFGRSVYDEYVLLRTWLCLQHRQSVSSPDDFEDLIEAVYDEEHLDDLAGAMQDRLELAKQNRTAKDMERAKKAQLVSVTKPDGGDVLEQWNKELDEDDPDTHESLRALTRLSGPSVQVACVEEVDGHHFIAGQPVDLSREPTLEEAKHVLQSMVTLSYYGCLTDFPPEAVPAAWRKSRVLRHCRLAEFRGSVCLRDKMALRLDPELGIDLERNGQ